ncbi:SDR family NAD(P)-dependent oxidoreductase [Hyphomonas oceanitis]|uniref:Short chain dehydrogenase/reductase family oxidoreductase n=1 Tax=Hyphomonas oceanitis SCH89 TaxID=1280953 RepID=A0A059G996_9PROT|nr:SDR family oxidoreductase [Hyphomonas oceanitis]KDA03392.1 short chain dehydrogenase/reductase family oxidoreductase [Hyphomonas oceanitis SCH89]
MARRLCLITGASAGIGAEFARQYAAFGWDLALTARRTERLEALAQELESAHGISAITIAEDLAKPEAVDAILAALEAKGRHVDALVNNAGYGLPGTFFNTSWEEQADFIRVLYTAPVELAHKVLPGMAERGYGRIINVASLAGYAAGSAGHTLYGSVKAAMIKFTESLNAECAATGQTDIHCTALCPGFTWSEFHDVNGTREDTNKMPKWMWMEAAPVVKAGIDAVNRGQPVVVPGSANKALATLTRILPESLGRAMVSAQSKRYRRMDT